MEWSTEEAKRFAEQGRLEEWIHSYLTTGDWMNLGLSDGLKTMKRWWIGPTLIPLENMIRTCGPEPDMPYPITPENWAERTERFASKLDDAINLPPVILENVEGKLYVRDGNHRAEAARQKGWQFLWALIWFDSEDDWQANQSRYTA